MISLLSRSISDERSFGSSCVTSSLFLKLVGSVGVLSLDFHIASAIAVVSSSSLIQLKISISGSVTTGFSDTTVSGVIFETSGATKGVTS